MSDYRLNESGGIVRTSDNATLPNDPLNVDRARYEAWVAAGNTPDAVPASRPPPTLDELYDSVIQSDRVLKAVVLALNDGSLVPGARVSAATLKATIKAKM